MATKEQLRFSVLATCVRDAPNNPGRTALMKYAYLLQTVRNVPLGYRFRLYNYGPYDKDVLGDLSVATADSHLTQNYVQYSNVGYGYEYETGQRFEEAQDTITKSVAGYEDDIKWVLDEFGSESAGRLELISTIVFAVCDKTRRREKGELVKVVHEIKPHFTEEVIAETYDEVSETLLKCVSCDSDE